VSVAALGAFDFQSVAEPNALAAAAPMAGHLAFRHIEMTRHGTNAEILISAGASGWRRARQRKAQDSGRIARVVVRIFIGHSVSSDKTALQQ